jgi:hypothetical protein
MTLSTRTKMNWLLDANIFLTALIASLTGIYFLYLPIGGYQGGRNPTYGLTVVFDRSTWDDLHTWFGVLMIIAGLIHLLYHWNWVRMMAKRLIGGLLGQPLKMSTGARINLMINAAIGLGFLLTAISGVYFLFQPRGMGTLTAVASSGQFIFTSGVWDLIHTWSSVVMILAASAHFIIHWGWIEKVTKGFFKVRPVSLSRTRVGSQV